MKTVSFQGVQLSANQRRALAFKQQVRQFMSPVLQEQVQAVLDRPPVPAVRPRSEWTVVVIERGTPCFADVFGF